MTKCRLSTSKPIDGAIVLVYAPSACATSAFRFRFSLKMQMIVQPAEEEKEKDCDQNREGETGPERPLKRGHVNVKPIPDLGNSITRDEAEKFNTS